MRLGITAIFIIITAILTNTVSANPGIIVDVGTPTYFPQSDGSTIIQYPLTISSMDEGYDTTDNGDYSMTCCEKRLKNIELDTSWYYEISPKIDTLIIQPGLGSSVSTTLNITVPNGISGPNYKTITTTTEFYDILLPGDLIFDWNKMDDSNKSGLKNYLKNYVIWVDDATFVNKTYSNTIEVSKSPDSMNLEINTEKTKVTFSNNGKQYNSMAQENLDTNTLEIFDAYTALQISQLGQDIQQTTIFFEIADTTPIPEFPTVALPIISVLGLVFLMRRRK